MSAKIIKLLVHAESVPNKIFANKNGLICINAKKACVFGGVSVFLRLYSI